MWTLSNVGTLFFRAIESTFSIALKLLTREIGINLGKPDKKRVFIVFFLGKLPPSTNPVDN